MTNVLSTISGQFGKAWILGSLFPALIFTILFYLSVAPLFPFEWSPLRPIQALDTQWRGLALLFVSTVLSAPLYLLNNALIRLFEGYPWKDTWIGRKLTERWQDEWRSLEAIYHGPYESVMGLASSKEDTEKLLARWNDAGRRLASEFPSYSLLLPTRLGNNIRSFEYYPDREYGMDAIILWPRFVAVIDRDYAAAIDAEKTTFDFLLNSAALSGVLAAMALVVGLHYPTPFASARTFWPWVATVVGFAVLARLLYLRSAQQAIAWGLQVRGSFDLYRGKLLDQLGYRRPPQARDAERAVWHGISQQMLIGDASLGPRYRPEFQDRRALLAGVNSWSEGRPSASLYTTRGVDQTADGKFLVTLYVKNLHPTQAVSGVVLADSIPDGFDYAWSSARIVGDPDPARLTVAGANPYYFTIGAIPPNDACTVTYEMLPRGK